MGQESLSVSQRSHRLVRRSPAPHQGARKLGCRLSNARRHLAGRLLQSAVVSHGNHAVDGAQERMAFGQDVSPMRRVEKVARGLYESAARGCLRSRSVHGRREVGHADGHDTGRAFEGAQSTRSGHFHSSYSGGQARDEEHLRVSGVQDEAPRSDIRLDVQFENEGEGIEMDYCWRRSPSQHVGSTFLVYYANIILTFLD